MGFLDVQQQSQLKSSQRAFGSTGNIPSLGVAKSSFNTFPANYFWGDTDGNYNAANAAGKYSRSATRRRSMCRVRSQINV